MKKQTFITNARREQIIAAAIQTLDEIGFVRASLAQIAKRANISTALISYHFSDKQDLMNGVLGKLLEQSSTYIMNSVFCEQSPDKQIEAFIRASLQYQQENPAKNIALIEIIFNAKTSDDILYYRLDDEEDDPITAILAEILIEGQKQGLFKKYQLKVMIDLIQGAIGEAMFHTFTDKESLQTYTRDLIEMIHFSIMK